MGENHWQCSFDWVIRVALVSVIVAVPTFPGLVRAQPADYEAPPTIYADDVLPSSLLRSGHHRVLGEVRTVGNSLGFNIESDYGSYLAKSIPMVLVRVHEIRTLAQAITQFERDNRQLATKLRGQLQVGADSFVDILTSPLDTTAQLMNQATHNVGQTFQELNNFAEGTDRGIERDAGGANVYEQLVPGDPIVASHKRSAASQLNLDVYSSNPRVQEFLDTVARARSSGRRTAGTATIALPRSVEARVASGRVEARIRSALTHKTIRELYRHNLDSLRMMAVEVELAHAFLSHPALSPRHKTAVVEYLRHLDGVDNRAALLEAALESQTEEEAISYVQSWRMLGVFHEMIEPLAGLVSSGHIPVAITRTRGLLVVLPFDVVYWDRHTEEIFSALAVHAAEQKYSARNVVLNGVLTPKGREQFAKRGFAVRERFLFQP